MPSRRSHQKRRHGCANCKQRRIRCGEERPSCQNCGRLGSRCSYLELDQEHALPNPVVQQELGAGQGSTHLQACLTTEDPHAHDGELINHYSNSTCLTVTDDVLHFPIWQVVVPEIAQSYPFLRHGLLALSAMHLRLTSCPSKRLLYTELAHQHQGEALKSYIPQLQMITEESCPALFAFSTILSALSYSFLQSEESDLQGEEYITRFLEIWKFLYGATVVATESKRWIRQSVLSPLVTLRSLENVLPHLDADPQVALQTLLEHIKMHGISSTSEKQIQLSPRITTASTKPTNQGNLYESSILLLSNAFPTADGKPPLLGAVIGWPIFIGKGFLELLREKDSAALIVLAYYGVALHSFNNFWWLGGLGTRLVRLISQTLGSDASPILQWPLKKVSSRP